ncbi:hypothetical protein KC319_g60 [Hortaea werneckii]|nr:hypothetical protein KC319_g60 [Hortaea werneckii]
MVANITIASEVHVRLKDPRACTLLALDYQRRRLDSGLHQFSTHHVWRRGAPIIGMMRIAACFRSVLVTATGSGFGPCLSFLNCHRGHPAHVLWSARSPGKTYGGGILSNLFGADRGALVIDTKKTGRYDLTGVAWFKFQSYKRRSIRPRGLPLICARMAQQILKGDPNGLKKRSSCLCGQGKI